jgi:hypothetical protein
MAIAHMTVSHQISYSNDESSRTPIAGVAGCSKDITVAVGTPCNLLLAFFTSRPEMPIVGRRMPWPKISLHFDNRAWKEDNPNAQAMPVEVNLFLSAIYARRKRFSLALLGETLVLPCFSCICAPLDFPKGSRDFHT